MEAETDSGGGELLCSHCGGAFVLPEADEAPPGDDDEAPQEAPEDAREALDNLRIRQIALKKRAILRQRSFAMAAAVACLLFAVQLIWYAARDLLGEGARIHTLVFAVASAVFIAGALLLLSRGRRLRRQFEHKPHDDENLPPPDFSTLSDGSQRWKDLENIREE